MGTTLSKAAHWYLRAWDNGGDGVELEAARSAMRAALAQPVDIHTCCSCGVELPVGCKDCTEHAVASVGAPT